MKIDISQELADKIFDEALKGMSVRELYVQTYLRSQKSSYDNKLVLEELKDFEIFRTNDTNPKDIIIFPTNKFPDIPTVYHLPKEEKLYKSTNSNKIFSQYQLLIGGIGNLVTIYQNIFGYWASVNHSAPQIIVAERFRDSETFEDELLKLKVNYFIDNFIKCKEDYFKSYVIGCNSKEKEKTSAILLNNGLNKVEYNSIKQESTINKILKSFSRN